MSGALHNAAGTWPTSPSSPDTALRDINDLVERGILKKDEGGGRSTSYSLAED
jgi:Fic family protein